MALFLGSCANESRPGDGDAAARPRGGLAAKPERDAAAKPGKEAATVPGLVDAGRAREGGSLETLLLAGLCDYPFAFQLSTCEGLDAMTDCAVEKCGLAGCKATCAELLACADAEADACSPDCVRTSECNDCLAEVVTHIPACLGELVCATTSPGGPCDRTRACCEVANDDDTKKLCHASVDLIARLSGDKGCIDGSKDDTFVMGYPDVSKCVDQALARDP